MWFAGYSPTPSGESPEAFALILYVAGYILDKAPLVSPRVPSDLVLK